MKQRYSGFFFFFLLIALKYTHIKQAIFTQWIGCFVLAPVVQKCMLVKHVLPTSLNIPCKTYKQKNG